MKTLANKATELEVTPGVKAKYADLAIACVKYTPRNGLNIEELRKRTRVLDVLEKGGDELQFEDADVETLKQCIKIMVWAVVHPGIVAFCDDIEKL